MYKIRLLLKKIFQNINRAFYFFPLRLFLNHIKENLVLILSWLVILLFVINSSGSDYGVPILFLSPEYFNVVGYFSFQIVGICFGAFYITWNTVSYLLYSYRYPFVASLKWPFAMFTFNNSIIPFVFLSIYVSEIVKYQKIEMGKEPTQIFWMIIGLLAGFTLVLLLTSFYFMLRNKNIFKYLEEGVHNFKYDSEAWYDLEMGGKADRVEYYISRKFNIRPIREVVHYDEGLLKKVFQQHHFNAFLIIIVNASILFGLGFVVDNPFFELPAAGTIFLFFSLIISLSGLVYHLAGKWGTFVLVVFIFSLNYLSKTEWMQIDSEAYGMDYSHRADYSIASLEKMVHIDSVAKDINETLAILEKWKAKNTEGKPYRYKPKMIFLLSSGGGNRAAAYTMKTLQVLDSLSEGELMKHTFLMSGASGGMMGVSYFRELYLKKHLGVTDEIYNEKYVYQSSGDLINKITSTVVTNDIFFGFKRYYIQNKSYNFDRGTAFELAFNKNTDDALKKPLSYYKTFEKNGIIPLMFINTINVQDFRKFIISPIQVRYMMQAYSEESETVKGTNIDAVDFRALFKQNDPDSLNVLTAIRMNATYPIILPNVSLPSEPKIDVFDAGIRDNFGIETATRFINVFQHWINRNTSGVIIIQIRDNLKNKTVNDFEYETFLSKLGSSFGSIYGNVTNSQDYLQNYMLDATDDNLQGNLEVYNLEYDVPKEEKRASLSLRLSQNEINNVIQAAVDSTNMKKIRKIIESLE